MNKYPNHIKNEIEQRLSVLIGLPFIIAKRALNLQMFEFGAKHTIINRKGKEIDQGEYTLHVQCAWRITQGDKIIVASQDRYYPGDGSDSRREGFDWTLPGNRVDKHLTAFFQDFPGILKVVSLSADDIGGVKILLDKQILLEVFPDNSDCYKYWRFFPLSLIPNSHHFVVTGSRCQVD
jgi:hypothetical protein